MRAKLYQLRGISSPINANRLPTLVWRSDMPIPRHSAKLPSVQIPLEADCAGVTELRVHGVGGTPPDAILGDLAPEQVSGDAIAGFYRSSDHRASGLDRASGADVDRHVEVYSWGGLTSQSKIRVL